MPSDPSVAASSVVGPDVVGTLGFVMGALAVGVLVVLVSSIAFGAAMFGRRPIPQPATVVPEGHPGAVTAPSSVGAEAAPRRRARAVTAEEARVQVSIPTAVKVRSGVMLGFTVLALAALVGVVLSVAVVGVGMFIS